MPSVAYIDPLTRKTYPLDVPAWRSPDGNPLMLTELPGITRHQIDTSQRSLWRYSAALPLSVTNPITMGEGLTPLHQTQFRGADCNFRIEWFSPTGSFKDRGASVMLSLLKEQGIDAVLEDSSGNGGAAIAGYGAAGGIAVTVFVPAATSPAKIAQSQAYGAHIELIPGPREATEQAAIARASQTFYASHNWHPFFLQGTKTLGYEIWEDLGFEVPDNIVMPVGAGSNLLGCHIAFTELMAAGETDRLPRLFATQPVNCAPLHASFTAGADGLVDTTFATTVAEGTAIKHPIRIRELLTALRETGGGTVAVTEKAITDTSLELARQGLYVEPTCAHAAAGFSELIAEGRIDPNATTVVILTGTGLKATQFYLDQLAQ